jgi:hypothetical protein
MPNEETIAMVLIYFAGCDGSILGYGSKDGEELPRSKILETSKALEGEFRRVKPKNPYKLSSCASELGVPAAS